MFKHKRSKEDFVEEIRAHLELEADALKDEGASAEEARRQARVGFGNVQHAEETFGVRGRALWLDNLGRDLRYGVRTVLQNPGFALTAIVTLALGIGANTAVFSVMNAVLLKSLPVADPQSLVYLRTNHPPNRTGTIDTNQTFSYPVYEALRTQAGVLRGVIAYVPLSASKVGVRIDTTPEEAEGDMVSGDFFAGLGVKLERGHGFTAQDEANHAAVAVISSRYWTRRFARSEEVLGKTLYVNGVPLTIVGVAAASFEGLEPSQSTDFWIPLQIRAELNAWGNPLDEGKVYSQDPTWWCLQLIARLAPGVTKTQAMAQLQSTFVHAAYVGLGNPERGEELPVLSAAPAKNFPGYDEMYGKPLKILMTMVGLVLLIALSNVAMLLLARNTTRRREFALRLALGAGRKVLFRQLLTESAVLVVCGGLLAWLFAGWATRALAAWAQIESSLAPDRTVLLFTLATLALAALLFGLAPLGIALSAQSATALRTTAATAHADAGNTKTGRVLVALQMALCLVLLVGAGLLVRTLQNLKNTPLGFSTDGLVVFDVKPAMQSVPQGIAFYQRMLERLRRMPGVEFVSIAAARLGSGGSNNFAMKVDGRLPDVPVGGDRTVRNNVVGPDFFHTLGVPVLEGREFTDADTAMSPRVAIINEEFAKKFLPNRNPLGHTISPDSMDFPMTIAGVVGDHKYRSITEDPIPMAWFMYAQIPQVGGMSVELRVKGDPLAILPSAQKAVQELDPNLPLIKPMTQRAQFDEGIAQQLMFARLAEFFGVLAIVLVATGLYGTLAFRVNTRTAEIGVRMALGAQRGQVVWMIVRDSLLLSAVGIVLGAPLAMLVGRALGSSLYGVQPLDAMSYGVAVLGVACV
ncbi:MAG: ABC transporter permease, partial [Terracidiphilus sp.]